MNDDIKTSKIGLEFLSRWEGCILHPYKDVAGLRTIGVGHLIKSNENFPDGVLISKERALEILSVDLEKCESAIKKNITVQLTQHQFDALVSFGFNCGVGVYINSGVCKSLNLGDYDHVPAKLLDWSKANVNGVLAVVKGLYDRRKAEGDLFSEFVSWTPEVLVVIQKKLQQLGLYTKAIDGLWGAGTNSGICTFAQNCDIQITDTRRGIPTTLFEAFNKL